MDAHVPLSVRGALLVDKPEVVGKSGVAGTKGHRDELNRSRISFARSILPLAHLYDDDGNGAGQFHPVFCSAKSIAFER